MHYDLNWEKEKQRYKYTKEKRNTLGYSQCYIKMPLVALFVRLFCLHCLQFIHFLQCAAAFIVRRKSKSTVSTFLKVKLKYSDLTKLFAITIASFSYKNYFSMISGFYSHPVLCSSHYTGINEYIAFFTSQHEFTGGKGGATPLFISVLLLVPITLAIICHMGWWLGHPYGGSSCLRQSQWSARNSWPLTFTFIGLFLRKLKAALLVSELFTLPRSPLFLHMNSIK